MIRHCIVPKLEGDHVDDAGIGAVDNATARRSIAETLASADGVDFVAALKADTTMPQVTVVFISGNAEVLERARRLGAPCLKKPFSADELLEVVRRELMLRPPGRRARLDYLSAST